MSGDPERRETDLVRANRGFSANQAMAGWVQQIMPFGILTTDRELKIRSWNEWLVTHSGLEASGVVGRSLVEVFPDLPARRLLQRYERALDGEISVLSAALHKYLLPFPVTVAESGLPYMLQTARIAPLPEGEKVTGTITIIEDVTQREFQAGILNRQQELDRLLSHALATLLQSADPVQEMEGIFVAVRLALGLDTYLGYLVTPAQNVLQLHTCVGLTPKLRESLATLQLTAQDQEILRGNFLPTTLSVGSHLEILRNAGIRAQCSFPLTVDQHLIGMVAFGSFERGSVSQPDLAILSRIARYVAIAIDRARRELKTLAASRAKDDFLAALSHELRTPLNPVLLVASDASSNPAFPDEAREAFRVIEKNVLLEARLIDDLLDLTRITHGKLALEMRPIDVHTNLRDAIQTVRGEMIGLSLRATLPPNLRRMVLGDSDRLQQVFWNVLKNAVKFTPRGGQIFVSSQSDPETNEISIIFTDTGVGMEPHELARVFEAFAQGDHIRPEQSHHFGGLGLGLAISRKIVEFHGGRIEATSPGKDQGSTFTIFLPLLPDDVALPPVPRKMTFHPGQRDSRSPHATLPRILLVEDHEPTRISLKYLLERRGYSVVSVPSAATALKEAAGGVFNLVLSDIGLPDDNGFSLMRQLRDAYGLKGIALTGYGMEEDLEQSRAAGFFAHLTKPISVSMLEETLGKAFESS